MLFILLCAVILVFVLFVVHTAYITQLSISHLTKQTRMLHEWMQITEEVDTKPNAREIDSLNQYIRLTKLLAHPIMCTALASVIHRTFWIWHCFIWNIRLKLNSLQLHICREKSESHTGINVTFEMYIMYGHMLKIYNFFFLYFLVFLAHFNAFLYLSFPFRIPLRNDG